jgi:outer membrane protein TolC
MLKIFKLLRMLRFYISLSLIFALLPVMANDTLSLQQAIGIAIENNYAIQISRNVQQIAVNNNTPGSAGMLPRISLEGSNTINIYNTHLVYTDGRVRDVDAARTSALSMRAMLNWTVFDGFEMFVDKSRLNDYENLSKVELKSKIEGTVAQVVLLYYSIVQQQKILQSLRNSLDVSNERLRLAKAKSVIGSGSDLSFLQAELDRNADSSRYISQL